MTVTAVPIRLTVLLFAILIAAAAALAVFASGHAPAAPAGPGAHVAMFHDRAGHAAPGMIRD